MAMSNLEHLAAPGPQPSGFGPGALGTRFPGPTPLLPVSYKYTMRHVIGYTADGVTSEGAMAALQKNPNRFFPFHVVGVGAAAGMGIKEGEIYDLQDVRWLFDDGNFVKVMKATSTSFTFLTLDGHFDGPGATIKFSTYEEGGVVYLQHDGNAPSAGVFNALVAPIGAKYTWDVQSSNLAIEMSGAEPYCYDAMGAPQ